MTTNSKGHANQPNLDPLGLAFRNSLRKPNGMKQNSGVKTHF